MFTLECCCCLLPLQVRERDWCNVLTAHEGDAAAYVWRLQHLSLGEHILRPPPKELQVLP